MPFEESSIGNASACTGRSVAGWRYDLTVDFAGTGAACCTLPSEGEADAARAALLVRALRDRLGPLATSPTLHA